MFISVHLCSFPFISVSAAVPKVLLARVGGADLAEVVLRPRGPVDAGEAAHRVAPVLQFSGYAHNTANTIL
jgi:hypothetical protein